MTHPLLVRGEGKCVTIIMSDDAHSGSFAMREEVLKFFPDARLAVIRDGGDFPYLSSPDDVNMYIEVHLRFAEGCARQGEASSKGDESEDAEDSSSSAAAAAPASAKEQEGAWNE